MCFNLNHSRYSGTCRPMSFAPILETVKVLNIRVLENHVLRGTRIDRSIAARDVLNRPIQSARLLRAGHTKQLLYRSSSSKVIGTASVTLTGISRCGRSKPHAARAHQDHGTVAHSVLSNDAHVAQTAALAVGNNDGALCPFARLLQAF
jgi:hypothetical protein